MTSKGMCIRCFSKLKELPALSLHRRWLAFEAPKQLPVIKIPKYIEENAPKLRQKQLKKNLIADMKSRTSRGDRNLLVISGKDPKLNHYYGATYLPNDVPMITKHWKKAKSIGEKMTFHTYSRNPSELHGSQSMSFSKIGLNSMLCESIHSQNIIKPTLIQCETIPAILEYKNIICSAETGSGKTIAYLAPMMQMIRNFKELNNEQLKNCPRGLVVVPSRELAEQVASVAQKLAAHCGLGVALMIGGPPKHMTHTGMDIVVSTIGLIKSHVSRGIYKINRLNHIVIDEADTLFDNSNSFDVLDLLQSIYIKDYPGGFKENLGTQLICVSATMPRDLQHSLGSVVDLDQVERITTNNLHNIMPHVRQDFLRIHKYDRNFKLLELVKKDDAAGRSVIIFSNRSSSANWIYHYLIDNGIQSLRLNKYISDEERLIQFSRFQEGECDVISCTDLGSRGLDTTRVQHVINFDCPHFVSDYIHRAGRTGRIGSNKQCLVTSFVSFKPDAAMVQELEKAVRGNKAIDYVNGNIKEMLRQNKLERENRKARKGSRKS